MHYYTHRLISRVQVLTDLLTRAATDVNDRQQANNFELIPGFVPAALADLLLAELTATADWQDEYLQMFGRRIRSPRRVCWHGDDGVGYRYSGVHHTAAGWLPRLAPLRERLVAQLGVPFNFVLLNYYQDQNDSMGWHADNEPELGEEPVIASLSFGVERTLLVRAGEKIPGVRRISKKLRLPHGSLLVMRGNSQRAFEHALPKSRLPCGPRLNLTFRQVYSLEKEVEKEVEKLAGKGSG